MFNGKPVWKQDDFTYEAVKVGDYVEQAIVDAAMDCVPPACMRADCSEMRGICMNDIEKINVAPDGYFQRIVKPCLLDLRKRKDDAKTDMERGYYEDRYAAQAKDFAEALHISAEVLDELIGGV